MRASKDNIIALGVDEKTASKVAQVLNAGRSGAINGAEAVKRANALLGKDLVALTPGGKIRLAPGVKPAGDQPKKKAKAKAA